MPAVGRLWPSGDEDNDDDDDDDDDDDNLIMFTLRPTAVAAVQSQGANGTTVKQDVNFSIITITFIIIVNYCV